MDLQHTLALLDSYKGIATTPANRHVILKDNTTVCMLIYLLDYPSSDVVLKSLQVLSLLTQLDVHLDIVANAFGIVPALTNAMHSQASQFTDETRSLSAVLYDRIVAYQETRRAAAEDTAIEPQTSDARPIVDAKTAPITSNANVPSAPKPLEDTSCNVPPSNKPVSTGHKPVKSGFNLMRAAHNPRFMAPTQATRPKTHTFQLEGELTQDSRQTVEQRLLKIRGVISIYFDSAKHRCVVRARGDILSQTLAESIASSRLFHVAVVTRDDIGEEILTPITIDDSGCAVIDENSPLSPIKSLPKKAIENEDNLPDYLNESFGDSPPPSDMKNERKLVRTARDSAKSSAGGWLGSVANFVSTSFYW